MSFFFEELARSSGVEIVPPLPFLATPGASTEVTEIEKTVEVEAPPAPVVGRDSFIATAVGNYPEDPLPGEFTHERQIEEKEVLPDQRTEQIIARNTIAQPVLETADHLENVRAVPVISPVTNIEQKSATHTLPVVADRVMRWIARGAESKPEPITGEPEPIQKSESVPPIETHETLPPGKGTSIVVHPAQPEMQIASLREMPLHAPPALPGVCAEQIPHEEIVEISVGSIQVVVEASQHPRKTVVQAPVSRPMRPSEPHGGVDLSVRKYGILPN